MKRVGVLPGFLALVCLGFILRDKNNEKNSAAVPQKENGAGSPVAVLELYTSEGCSSCPPADNLLPELAGTDPRILPLSFHVDYWNRLGWTDPFSSSASSERQRRYRSEFKLESSYTPQLIVNGETEFVGSDRNKAEAAIKKALQEKATVQLEIRDVEKGIDRIRFNVKADGEIKKTDLVAVLVQKKAVMNVNAGENKGARLAHTNVVRCFLSQPAAGFVKFDMPFPKEVDVRNWELIVFAQQEKGLKITGACHFETRQIE